MLCYKCNEEKDESLFTKSNRHKHENVGLCKRCKYLRDRKYREEHREQIAKNKREYWQNNVNGIREKNRATIDRRRIGMTADELEGKKCSVCGISNEESKMKYGMRLSVHHIDNNGRHNINNGELPKHENLQILCCSCHTTKGNLQHRDYSNYSEVLKKVWETRRKKCK